MMAEEEDTKDAVMEQEMEEEEEVEPQQVQSEPKQEAPEQEGEEKEEEEEKVVIPADANETIYIKNLNEKVKLDVLKKSLEALFSTYGTVLSVTAHSNVRMRGQAFVAFESKEPAAKAVSEVVGFPLYGKPMQVAFAKTKSDSVVALSNDKSTFEAHKTARKELKRKQRNEYMHLQRVKRRQMEHDDAAGGAATTSTTTGASSKRQEMQMPDEYLPPNKILFLHNVPERISRDELDALFRPYQGLQDVRIIPGRNVAFIEFADSITSSIARDALNTHAFGPGESLRITFAK